MQLAIGDAIAIAALKKKQFSKYDFSRLHPGGNLGKQLKTVGDIIATGKKKPLIDENKNMKENIVFLKEKKTCILKKEFFDQAHEVILRSLTTIIQTIGKKYYPTRGKSIDELINRINNKSFSKIISIFNSIAFLTIIP